MEDFSMLCLLHHLLADGAARYLNKEAIVFQGNKVTYAELEKESNRLANSLSEISMKRGQRVVVYMSRGYHCLDRIFLGF
jgi:acyl-CoA synthetase (AMP-forming)/AMP-acid ligase II